MRVTVETRDDVAHTLLKLGLLSEQVLAEQLSQFLDLPRWIEVEIAAPVEVVGLNTQFLKAHELVPLGIEEDRLLVACWDGLDDAAIRGLRFSTKLPVRTLIATRTQIRELLDRLYPEDIASMGDFADAGRSEEAEFDRLKDLASDAPIIRLLQDLVSRAVVARASDIHIEPIDENVVVRYRQDGLLRQVAVHPLAVAAPLVSRVKVMAGLNIAERRLPQDGRIRVAVQGKEIDFRVATTPVLQGESVVLRILDRQDVALDFAALGFDDTLTSVIREAINRPFGIVLVTGPTGSGKTTTLYAALKEINTPDKKILTAEDPVEYTLSGVNQVPMRPQIGLSFAQALRSFLRQDPDILMVGEIRDRETAEIAIQAALTGHLLLSTLHTNSAAAAVTRLLDMGIDDYLLTSTLHLILGQRLVRRLCLECREPYRPEAAAMQRFGRPEDGNVHWYRSVGCPACQGSGFRGRTSILEALPVNEQMRGRILAGADAHTLESEAVAAGMRTMFQHGLSRVAAGETTVEEVLRVTNLH